MSALADRAAGIAEKYLGVDSNDPRVAQWLKNVGAAFPNAWCAAFTYNCFAEAAQTKAANPCPKTASALNAWGKTDPGTRIVAAPDMELQRGDVYVIYRGNGHGHVGVVCGFDEHGMVNEVSGNSTAGKVARHVWNLNNAIANGVHEGKLLGVIRW